MSEEDRQNFLASAIEFLDNMSSVDRKSVLDAYSYSLRKVFLCFTVIAGACTAVGLFIKVGLGRPRLPA